MATAVVPLEGRRWALDWLNSGIGSVSVSIGLYNTNYTPVLGDTYATYAAMSAATPGLGPVVNAAAPASTVDPNNNATSQVFNHTFTATGAGPETIYGWYMYFGGMTPQLIAACLLDAPVAITAIGDSVPIVINDFAGALLPPL